MVWILKDDFITFQGQDLFPLPRLVIKINGIRFGIIFAFHTTLQRHLRCSASGKPSAHLFTQSAALHCVLTMCQAPGLTQGTPW